MANPCHVRSISLPSRSHPTTLKIQEVLNRLKTLEASSTSTLGAICNGLSGLEELYKCLEEFLSLPSTQQALSHYRNDKWLNELLDGPVRLLDICGTVRDVVSKFEENVRDLRSALRRKKGDLCRESSISNYIYSKKKMNKDAKKLLAAMKKMDTGAGASPLLDQDQQLSTVIRVLTEVNAMSISIFQSLVLFLSTPVLKSKPSKWSLVSKYMHKGIVSCEEKHDNVKELENMDFALRAVSSERADLETMQIAHQGLEALEFSIKGLDNGLECMFRHLIKTRASLLNIISH
ncbi:hypothetical protein PVL29_005220 [Vitis rotundifolia]|uniref:Uncharacterized protein n=1 Tax=Vitis rotundifolia TaxID=103349 RepID=A0AA39E1L0_VITRO|nr:hypothetical protein PVL29_005220 [Vitis rotundifolia]